LRVALARASSIAPVPATSARNALASRHAV
jgi:hypothetical protein